MKKSEIKNIISNLKNAEEDFEFYPTSKDMIKRIFDHIDNSDIDVLDIGCGTCNFKRFYEEIEKEEYKIRYETALEEAREDYERNAKEYEEKYNTPYDRENNSIREPNPYNKTISKYYVMEKSKILLDRLDRDIIVLGTNFHDSLLIDKPVKTIFCNPPYTEYKNWMIRIIKESNCYDIYLIVPERWKEDKDIQALLKRKELIPKILGKFDFLEADRKSRAKVDILFINKKPKDCGTTQLDEIEQSAFDEWFDKTFNMQDSNKEEEKLADYEKHQKEKDKISNKIVNCKPKDKTKILVDLYTNELNTLFKNFKAICSMDTEVLTTIGVSKESIKEAIKQKTVNLKILYWETVFNELEGITERLTSKTRDSMLDKFKELKTVDFTEANIYSLIIWIIKNANKYYNDQLITFYKELSSSENVRPYKSNIRTFEKDGWRFADKHTHYTLDYRIICRNHLIGVNTDYSGEFSASYDYQNKIKDISAIFNNLGFEIVRVEHPYGFGQKCYAYGTGGKILFEFRTYKNGNLHIKFNIEFTKALNVEVGRLLGWIRKKEDIKDEFCEEMADGAEKYFKANQQIGLTNIPLIRMGDESDIKKEEFKQDLKEKLLFVSTKAVKSNMH